MLNTISLGEGVRLIRLRNLGRVGLSLVSLDSSLGLQIASASRENDAQMGEGVQYLHQLAS